MYIFTYTFHAACWTTCFSVCFHRKQRLFEERGQVSVESQRTQISWRDICRSCTREDTRSEISTADFGKEIMFPVMLPCAKHCYHCVFFIFCSVFERLRHPPVHRKESKEKRSDAKTTAFKLVVEGK